MLKAIIYYIDTHSEEYNIYDISNLNNDKEISLLRENGMMTYIPYNTLLSITIIPIY